MTLAPFRRFSIEDQQEILTKVLVEMMILHTTAKYDCTTRSIPTNDGSQINKLRFKKNCKRCFRFVSFCWKTEIVK